MSSITLNSGSGGASLGTDQVAGTPNVDYQIVKIGYSVAGSAPTQVSAGAPLPVDGSSVTQPISAASLPLPTGAATAAKQPALGTAGTASADILTVQGIASMTALKVDGSAVTQPVSGTFWQATQPVSGTITANAGTGTFTTTDIPATSGGLSVNAFVGAASNNKTEIKASAGQLYFISVQNLASTPVYLKVFDKTSANVTAGTTACDYQFMIPGNTAGAGVVLNIDKGIAHANGITIMLTAGIATTDNTSVSASNQVVVVGYK